MFYAGIGSRSTPHFILSVMEQVGAHLASKGLVLRSGGAEGADIAFERGCDRAEGEKEIFIPWNGFNDHWENRGSIVVGLSNPAVEVAKTYHTYYEHLSVGVKKLMARNSCQILGKNCDSWTNFIICWTPPTGGTTQALRIAKAKSIPFLNLYGTLNGSIALKDTEEFCRTFLE